MQSNMHRLFIGPFRDAAGSAPSFGDRKSYQMDYHNRREGMKEALTDIEEGADIIMIKPAMSYLDMVSEVSKATNVPIAAYSVSGEYAMVKAAAKMGWIDEEKNRLRNGSKCIQSRCEYISYLLCKRTCTFY